MHNWRIGKGQQYALLIDEDLPLPKNRRLSGGGIELELGFKQEVFVHLDEFGADVIGASGGRQQPRCEFCMSEVLTERKALKPFHCPPANSS